MKSILISLYFLLVLSLMLSCKKSEDSNTSQPTTDSFSVVVQNGYGTGTYKIGDTVHIFTNHYSENQLFDQWTGDINILSAANEWSSWFVMPNRNVHITGSIKNSIPFNLQLENMMGRDRIKPVYYYFPTDHKGIVYLLHGSNGNAAHLVNGFEFQLLIRDLVDDNFAVIITEAEEATTGIDANGDGKLRWSVFPSDSITNVDHANIRIITDTFYNRGFTDRTKLRFSIGMSAGGFYSAALSDFYNFKAGVNYCAQVGPNIIATTNTPIQFCMASNDNNDAVGPAGNAAAFANFNALNANAVCSKFFMKERSPIYPERFARRGDISTTQSIAIFNELKSKGYLDGKRYFIGYSDGFMDDYAGNPTGFPIINGLTIMQRIFVLEQINLSIADHHMYSDFNRATLKFLNMQCQ